MNCKYRAGLYIRVSTEEQAAEGQSVSAQIETLTQFCKLYDIEVSDIYKDLGISGKDTINRPELNRMLTDARNGCINLVLVWKISRLSRRLKDLLMMLEEFDKLGIVFSSYSEKFDTSTAVGKMTLQLLGSIAEFERNTIIDNVNLGLTEFARKGGKTGTVLGYNNINKQLMVNPDEAELVKLIYKLYTINQMSMSQIAYKLNSLGFRTKRNNSFTKGSIGVILSNPVYIAINRHKIGLAEEYKTNGSHVPIIDTDTWNTAQSLRVIHKKKRPAKNKKLFFLLSGKIQCPSCGSFMYSFTSNTASKTYRYYRCKGCRTIVSATYIENAVVSQLQESLNNESLINKLTPLFSKLDSMSEENNMSLLQKESEKLQILMDKYVLLLDIKALDSNEIILGKIKDLENKQKEIYKTMKTFATADEKNVLVKSTPHGCADKLQQTLLHNDKEEVKTLIDTCINQITLSSNKTLKEILFRFDSK